MNERDLEWEEWFALDQEQWWAQHKQEEDERRWLAAHEEWVQLEFDFEFAPLPLHMQPAPLCHFA